MAASASRSAPFVGRTEELAALRRTWTATREGQGGIVLLSGEAGIGKTRLTEELAASVTDEGGRVVWGRCYEGEGAPAFWPWIQAFSALLDQPAGQAAFDADPDLYEPLNRLLSAAGARRPSGRFLGAETSGDYDRFRLFTACDHLLADIAMVQPVLLVLEDLHWADQASLMVIEFLARQGRLASSNVLLVGTYRDQDAGAEHPLAASLGKITRGCVRDRRALTGLGVEEVGRLIEAASLAESGRDAAAVHAHTDGNPLFIQETLHLLATAASASDAASLPLPAGIEQTISVRLNGLSPSCHEVLHAAAVVGRDFSLVTLAAITVMAVDSVLEAVDEAERARVIRAHDAPGRYRFGHNLVRETLYRSLGPGARMRLHQKAGQAIERSHSSDLGPYYAELAHHFHQSAPLGEATRAMRYYRLHADRSMGQLAYEAAVDGAMAAIRIHDDGDAHDPVELGVALVTLGSARFRLGERDVARATFRRAVGSARELMALQVPEGAGIICRAALAFTGQELGYGASDPEGIELLSSALAVAPADDPAVRIRIMASLGAWVHFAGRQDEAAVLLNGALEESATVADGATRSHVLNSWHATLRNAGNLPARLRVSTELRDIGLAKGDPEATIFGLRRRVMDFADMGEGAAMEAEMRAHDDLAARLRQPIHTWHTALWKAMTALREGDLGATEALAFAALQAGQQAQALNAMNFFAPVLFALRQEQGRGGELTPTIRALATAQPLLVLWRAVLAMTLVEGGEADEARAIFRKIMAEEFDALPMDGQWGAMMYALTQVCAALDDGTAAARLLDLITPFSDAHLTGGNAIVYLGPLHLCIGRLLLVCGRTVEAAAALSQAVAASDQMGARLFAAIARSYLGIALAGNDPPRSAALLRAGRQEAEAIGSVRLLAAIDGFEAARPHTAAGRASLPAGLSAREAEVLRLLAAGRSNQHIADELVLSSNTVARHISNIYLKLDVANRTEAARWAVDHDILGS